MDKLKPILAQKFWIFFGVVLILPVVGYFMTKGELAAQIETRWSGLDKTFTDIPTGADCPNEQWTQGLTVLNDPQFEFGSAMRSVDPGPKRAYQRG